MEEAQCVSEKVFKGEAPCVKETTCVRSLYVREMTVGMRENATCSCSGERNISACSLDSSPSIVQMFRNRLDVLRIDLIVR